MQKIGKFGKCKRCEKRDASDKDGLCDNCRYMGLLTGLLEERTLHTK